MTGAEFEGVDLDLLADYVGGALLGTPEEERVATLVAEDPAWQAAYQELAPAMAAVGASLLDLPPEPMPEDLAARLDEMFRTTPDVSAGESAEPVPARVLDLEKGRRDRAARTGRRRAPRWAKPVAVAAGLVAFAGFGLNQLSSPAYDEAQSTAAGAAPDAEAATMVAAMPDQVLQSGTDYNWASLGTSATLDSAAKEPRTFISSDAVNGQSATGSALARLLAPDLLLSCLEKIAAENAGGPLSVLFVDYASFEGAPALIVRFTAANGGWSWAVGPDCGTPAAGAAELAKVPVR
ncbi:hypothetical protein OHA21_39430 [Actinoplanes sp. NBC_00393]|uniref:hypothetical protein n=1 Tax=Actinoplanes sp. NBC_00393 TaxID=2975953 RepID=UPI002E1A96C9